VSDAERTDLRIWTIGAYDVPKAERLKRRKENDRLDAKARRQARGAKPRELSASRTQPWEAFGISRSTWERRGKPLPQLTQIRRQHSSLIPSDEFSSSSTNGHALGLAPVVPSSGTNRQRHDLSRRSPSLAEAKPRQRQQRKAVQASKDILMPAPEPTMQAVEAWQIEALNKAFSSTNALH